jgi:hypothetical protein
MGFNYKISLSSGYFSTDSVEFTIYLIAEEIIGKHGKRRLRLQGCTVWAPNGKALSHCTFA